MKHCYVFGQFQLHTSPLQLREGRRVVDLSGKQLEVLSLLVQAQGKLISKEIFFEKVWRDSNVEQGNLTQTVFLIRKALGKLPNHQEFIETIPGKGYRLSERALRTGSGTGNPIGSTSDPAYPDPPSCEDEQFRTFINSIEDYAIYILDCTGRVLTWNVGAEKNEGYSQKDVLGKHYSMFFTSEDIDALVPNQGLALAAKLGRYSGEGWRMRKNGERFWASFVISAVRNPTGKLIGFTKVVRDLSDEKRQQDALLKTEALHRRERDRLSAAVESSPDAFCICQAVRDQKGEVEDFAFTYLNRNVAKVVAIPREKLIGGKMCELLPFTRTHGLFDECKKVLLTGEPYIAEFPIGTPHTAAEWLRVQAVRLEDGIAITASDITTRKEAEQRILHLAQHDPLTGLANRTLLSDYIKQAMAYAQRNGGHVGVMVLDLDNFKQINDNLGRRIGDLVLTEVANRMRDTVRPSDAVIRLGGDEFAVVFQNHHAEKGVKKVVNAIQAPMMIESTPLTVTCSIGVALYPGCANSEDELLSEADAAMCAVKNGSRNHLHDDCRTHSNLASVR